MVRKSKLYTQHFDVAIAAMQDFLQKQAVKDGKNIPASCRAGLLTRYLGLFKREIEAPFKKRGIVKSTLHIIDTINRPVRVRDSNKKELATELQELQNSIEQYKEPLNEACQLILNIPQDFFDRPIYCLKELLQALQTGAWPKFTKFLELFGDQKLPQSEPYDELSFEAKNPVISHLVERFISLKRSSPPELRKLFQIMYGTNDVDVARTFRKLSTRISYRLQDEELPAYHKIVQLDSTRYVTTVDIKSAVNEHIIAGKAKSSAQSDISVFTEDALLVVYMDYDDRYRNVIGNYSISTFRLIEYYVNDCNWDCIVFVRESERSPIYVKDEASVSFADELVEPVDLKHSAQYLENIRHHELGEQIQKGQKLLNTPLSKDSLDLIKVILNLTTFSQYPELTDKIQSSFDYLAHSILRDDFSALSRYLFAVLREFEPHLKLSMAVLILNHKPVTLEEVNQILSIVNKHYKNECKKFSNRAKKNDLPKLETFRLFEGLVESSTNEDGQNTFWIARRLRRKLSVSLDSNKASLELRRCIHWILACNQHQQVEKLTEIRGNNFEHDIEYRKSQVAKAAVIEHLLASCDVDNDRSFPFPYTEKWKPRKDLLKDSSKKPNSTELFRTAYQAFTDLDEKEKHRLSNYDNLNHLKLGLAIKFANAGFEHGITDVPRRPSREVALPAASFCLIDAIGARYLDLVRAICVAALRTQENKLLDMMFIQFQTISNLCAWGDITHLPLPLTHLGKQLDHQIAYTRDTRIETVRIHHLVRTGELATALHVIRNHYSSMLNINTVGGLSKSQKAPKKNEKWVVFSKKQSVFFVKLISQNIRLFLLRFNLRGARKLTSLLTSIREQYIELMQESISENKKSNKLFIKIAVESFTKHHFIKLQVEPADINKGIFPSIGDAMEIYRLAKYCKGLLTTMYMETNKNQGFEQLLTELENIFADPQNIDDLQPNQKVDGKAKHEQNEIKNYLGIIENLIAIQDSVHEEFRARIPNQEDQTGIYKTNLVRSSIYQYLKTITAPDIDDGDSLNKASEFGRFPGKYLEILNIYISCQHSLMREGLHLTVNYKHLCILNYQVQKLVALCDEYDFKLFTIDINIMRISLVIFNQFNQRNGDNYFVRNPGITRPQLTKAKSDKIKHIIRETEKRITELEYFLKKNELLLIKEKIKQPEVWCQEYHLFYRTLNLC